MAKFNFRNLAGQVVLVLPDQPFRCATPLGVFRQFGIMLVHAVRLESDHSEILARFLEPRAALQTSRNALSRLDPNVWKVDLLTERIVVPSLQFAEMDSRTVHSGPENARSHPNEFPVFK
jgi:hypothetical protein